MMSQQLLHHSIALTLIPGVGDVAAKKLIAYCGSPTAVFKTKKSQLLKIPGLGEATASSILHQKVLKQAEKEVKFIEHHKIEVLYYLADNYPKRLKHCQDAPLLLYHKGTTKFNEGKMLSIVGTRNATEYGKNITRQLIEELKIHQVTIISGLAYGIDICAHKAALQHELKTVAVLAHGLDRLYPPAHKTVADKIIEKGGLLTDFISETNPDRENFPKRNRIVAGLSDATIVVEASNKGGALITAEIANSYNRDVFAVPGRLNDTFSSGCNRLIKTNKAALIESAKDIEYLLGWTAEEKVGPKQQKLFVELSSEEETIVQLLSKHGNLPVDDLTLLSELSMSKVAALLLNLEFNGLVKSLPGKVYQLC